MRRFIHSLLGYFYRQQEQPATNNDVPNNTNRNFRTSEAVPAAATATISEEIKQQVRITKRHRNKVAFNIIQSEITKHKKEIGDFVSSSQTLLQIIQKETGGALKDSHLQTTVMRCSSKSDAPYHPSRYDTFYINATPVEAVTAMIKKLDGFPKKSDNHLVEVTFSGTTSSSENNTYSVNSYGGHNSVFRNIRRDKDIDVVFDAIAGMRQDLDRQTAEDFKGTIAGTASQHGQQARDGNASRLRAYKAAIQLEELWNGGRKESSTYEGSTYQKLLSKGASLQESWDNLTNARRHMLRDAESRRQARQNHRNKLRSQEARAARDEALRNL